MTGSKTRKAIVALSNPILVNSMESRYSGPNRGVEKKAGDLGKEFNMQIANVQGNLVNLLVKRKDMRMLEIAVRAGLNTDPILRRTTDEETKALHGKITSLIKQMDSGEIDFSLSRDEFLNMSIIVGVVNTMDPEIYYEDMLDEFPSDDDLDNFTQRLEGLYDYAFRIG